MWTNILTLDVKAVLLDLDDTLYSYKPCHDKALEAWIVSVSESLQISYEQAKEEYLCARSIVNTQLHGTASSHSRLLYSQKVSEKFGLNAKDIILWESVYWKTFIESMKVFPLVIPFLETCQQKNIKICLVSDMTAEIQFKKLIHLGIDTYFDFIVTSEESGQEKPLSYPFLLALHKLNLKAQDVIMIGDSEEKDIKGAKTLGILSFLPFFTEAGNDVLLK